MGQCTATECKAEAGLVSVSLGVAGLLWLVAVCEDVGLSEGGEFESKVGMGAGNAGSAGTAAGVGLMGTGIAGSVWPAALRRGLRCAAGSAAVVGGAREGEAVEKAVPSPAEHRPL